jgi:hypothetical protein
VRDQEALAKLPEAERAEVEVLLRSPAGKK